MSGSRLSLNSIINDPCANLQRKQPSPATLSAIDFPKPLIFFLLIGMLLTGCASVPKDYPRTPSTAFTDYLDTSVGQLFEEAAAKHPGESGFALIRDGRPAFTARVALTELAEKSLDVQYYIWEADSTGWILADRLMQAADRGAATEPRPAMTGAPGNGVPVPHVSHGCWSMTSTWRGAMRRSPPWMRTRISRSAYSIPSLTGTHACLILPST